MRNWFVLTLLGTCFMGGQWVGCGKAKQPEPEQVRQELKELDAARQREMANE